MGHTERDAFSDYTQFPRGRKVISNLDSTPVTVFAAGTNFKITHFQISGDNTERLVTFRPVGGGTTILTIHARDGNSVTFPGWQTDEDGVEVLTDSATNDINITMFTVEPTIS